MVITGQDTSTHTVSANASLDSSLVRKELMVYKPLCLTMKTNKEELADVTDKVHHSQAPSNTPHSIISPTLIWLHCLCTC